MQTTDATLGGARRLVLADRRGILLVPLRGNQTTKSESSTPQPS